MPFWHRSARLSAVEWITPRHQARPTFEQPIIFDRAVTRQQAVHTAVSNGRFAVTNVKDGGLIEAGSVADMLLLERFSVDVNRNSKGVPKSAQIRFGLL
jgi:predicted amidohydrolase YtcJ